MNPLDRFWKKINKKDDCWVWTAGQDGHGYGMFFDSVKKVNVKAYRWSYENFIGLVPNNLQLDHLCRNRICVNPNHLEPVTQQENIKRGEAGKNLIEMQLSKVLCPKNHKYDKENTYIRPDGGRGCRKCRAEANKKQRMKMKVLANV